MEDEDLELNELVKQMHEKKMYIEVYSFDEKPSHCIYRYGVYWIQSSTGILRSGCHTDINRFGKEEKELIKKVINKVL